MKRLALLVVFACSKEPSQPPSQPPAPAPESPAAPAPAAHTAGAIQWIHDDYPAALAKARAENKPIFLDAWALWCHTCLAMQNYVFPDPGMAPVADRFVWLAIDTEKESNAPVVAKFTPEVWPTFFIIDAKDESIHGRWAGSASVTQMKAFAADGERSVQQAHATALAPDDPLALLLAADRAAAQRSYADAAGLYGEALKKAPEEWARRPDALVGRMVALWRSDKAACVDLGLAAMDQTGSSASASDFAAFALMCADELPPADPRVAKARQAVIARLEPLVADEGAPLSADDRGDAYGWIIEAHEKLGNAERARAVAEERRAFLDAAAAAAPTPAVAATFDMHRSDTYVKLGRGEEAIAFLKKRTEELPTDYNPWHWMSRVYLELDRPADALAANEKALALNPGGPRKGRLLEVRVQILEKLGKKDEARAAARAVVDHYKALPPAMVRPGQIENAEKKLVALH